MRRLDDESEAPGGASPHGRPAPPQDAASAVLYLQRAVGNQAVGRMLSRDHKVTDPDTLARQDVAKRFSGLTRLRVDDAFGQVESMRDGELARMVTLQPVPNTQRELAVSTILMLEQARREKRWRDIVELLYGPLEQFALAFLRRLTVANLQAIAGTGVNDARLEPDEKAQVRRWIPHALAMKVAGESEGRGLRDMRYLHAKELEAVEDAAAALDKAGAKAVRERIRTIRDSISIEDVKTLINEQLEMWGRAVCTGVLTAKLDQSEEKTEKWFLIALGGNLVWAITGFIPQTRGIWLGIKIVGQIGGAIAGSNTAQEVLAKAPRDDPSTEFRLGLTDMLTVRYRAMMEDVTLIHAVADELWEKGLADRNADQESIERRNVAWHLMFGDTPKDPIAIQRDTAGTIESIWKQFWPFYSARGVDELNLREQIYRAFVASGVADKLGYRVEDPRRRTWAFPERTVVTEDTGRAGGYNVQFPR
jgi:hypothetical protein